MEKLFETTLLAEYTMTKSICSFKLPLSLYHYTGVEGYNGIIKEKLLTFRFTRSDCFEDITEGIHIIKIYKKACKLLLRRKQISKEFFQLIKCLTPTKQTWFRDDTNALAFSTFKSYICCFTDKENSLKMWRRYGKGRQKYKLKLSPTILNKYMYDGNKDVIGMQANISCGKVIYKTHEKLRAMYQIIVSAYKLYEMGKNEVAKDIDKRVPALLQYQLQILQYIFKKRKYAYESEYRIIYIRPDKRDENTYPYVINKSGKSYVDLTIVADELYLQTVKTRPAIDISEELANKGFGYSKSNAI